MGLKREPDDDDEPQGDFDATGSFTAEDQNDDGYQDSVQDYCNE